MAHPQDYETARQRAKAKYEFFVHAIVFAAVMVLLVVINLVTSSDYLWFIWPLLGWGLALVLHGARVFLMADRDTIIDALTDHELDRMDADHRDGSR